MTQGGIFLHNCWLYFLLNQWGLKMIRSKFTTEMSHLMPLLPHLNWDLYFHLFSSYFFFNRFTFSPPGISVKFSTRHQAPGRYYYYSYYVKGFQDSPKFLMMF